MKDNNRDFSKKNTWYYTVLIGIALVLPVIFLNSMITDGIAFVGFILIVAGIYQGIRFRKERKLAK